MQKFSSHSDHASILLDIQSFSFVFLIGMVHQVLCICVKVDVKSSFPSLINVLISRTTDLSVTSAHFLTQQRQSLTSAVLQFSYSSLICLVSSIQSRGKNFKREKA